MVQKQIQLENGIENLNTTSITQYYSSEYKRQRHEIQDCDDYQPCRAFLDEELVIRIMMDTRTTGAVKFRATLGINQHDPILTKEKSIDSKITKVFSDEEIIEQYFVLNEKLIFIFLRTNQQQKLMNLVIWTEMKNMK